MEVEVEPVNQRRENTAASDLILEECGRLSESPYSTVTDFARLRGWSASFPMMTAVW